MSNKIKHKGFTLIELVITIAMLGIFSAVAIPLFANLKTNSEKVAVQSIAGTFQSAIKIAQQKWRTSNKQRTNLALSGSNTSGNFINMVDFSQFGCPVQHWSFNAETDPRAGNSADCLTVFLLVLDRCHSSATNCNNQPDIDFSHSYLGGGVCEYSYRNNNSYKIRYETDTQGCPVTTSGL